MTRKNALRFQRYVANVRERRDHSAASANMSARVITPALCGIQRAPECLSIAAADDFLGKGDLSVLIDPGSLLSFVNKNSNNATSVW